ncbi:hypothetical protein OD350_28825 (plasmid) [Clostridium beijerinckii]|uniref:hypothetical protein n=1 Tax=Clostridium beijerinckii TaxID=1520 RepID=UPI002226DF05|nr:hypothetical protein [Clostridium beijerinckii]UYZ39079.1 hypothetical protein OD350_28825 [Clostridium beijerinckii]
MSNVFYAEKSLNELDQYYRIVDESVKKTGSYDSILADCKKIQSAFNKNNVHLTLRECQDLYASWSDERYCSSWTYGIEDMTEDEIFNLLFSWLNTFICDRIGRLETICGQMKPLLEKKSPA